jgi:hypothetical protein
MLPSVEKRRMILDGFGGSWGRRGEKFKPLKPFKSFKPFDGRVKFLEGRTEWSDSSKSARGM